MARPLVVAVLDTFWGDHVMQAPHYFHINPRNHSGRRLYKLVGTQARLLVTDVCPLTVTAAHHHSKPSCEWLMTNLQRLAALQPIALLLVCGAVAQRTYQQAGLKRHSRVIFIKHPAARTWCNDEITKLQKRIERKLADG